MTIAHGPVTPAGARTFPRNVGSAMTMVAAAGLVVAAMFLPVVQNSDATTTGYAIRDHQRELADLQARIFNTQATIADLGSMNRIRTEAARLGMVPATTKTVSFAVQSAPPDQVLLPRRFLPVVSPRSDSGGDHSALWSIIHAVSLR